MPAVLVWRSIDYQMSDDDLPASRWARFGRVARLGGKFAAERTASLLGSEAAEARIAEALANTLGEMRGIAMKVGQMASYVDGMIPAEYADLYEKTLRGLRASAPTMSAEAAARVVEQELGASPHRIFAEWDPDPFASASLGQVHRARLVSGAEVAVKVQYEGVARAVASDLANVATIQKMLGPLAGRMRVREYHAEVKARFSEELDYRKEAENQNTFRLLFTGAEGILVPRAYTELTTARVLTSELGCGLSYEEACRAPEDERCRWAERLWYFVFTAILHHGHFNADPQPANFVFVPSSRDRAAAIWFLDFGCVRVLPRHRLALVRRMHRAAITGERAEIRDRALGLLDIETRGPLADTLGEYMVRCLEPFSTRGKYCIDREYVRSLMDHLVKKAKKELVMASLRGKFKGLPPELLFFNRLQVGFYSLLARLEVAMDYHALHSSIVEKIPCESD
jgi:predicted unusual protein kinase regulating ubiquinone biosynthesis (AarF/ABC1/UbiB family)